MGRWENFRECATRFESADVLMDNDGLTILDQQVVQYWERPIMEQLARFATAPQCNRLLEVGYGLGMCSKALQEAGVSNHTIIEAHPVIAQCAARWAERCKSRVIIVEGFWQDVLQGLGEFDSIVFDPTPLGSKATRHYEEFIPIARRHLRPGGRLTYISLEPEISREHDALLRLYFDDYDAVTVEGLSAPSSCRYWRGERMAIPCARVTEA